MDHDQEIKRAKRLLFALAFFLMTGFWAFDELRYAVWGKVVQGQVLQSKAVMISGRRGSQSPMLSVEYSFPAESGPRTERDLLPLDWSLAGNTVPIQYIPGSPDSSRLAGHRNMTSVYLFMGSLGVISIFLFALYREAKASERRPARQYR